MKRTAPIAGVVFALTLTLVSASPAVARADGACHDVCAMSVYASLGVMAAALSLDLVLLGADIGYLVQGEHLPTRWAVTQLIAGTLQLGFSAFALGNAFRSDGQLDQGWLNVGVASGLLGLWFSAHAIGSLALDIPRRSGPAAVSLSASPFGVSFRGSF